MPDARLRLEDLIAPLTVAEFRARHWSAGVPFVSQPTPSVIEKIKAIDGLQNVETLVGRLNRDVMLFGPKHFRSSASPKEALTFLHAGFNLYISQVESALPHAISHFSDVAEALGLPPWQVSVEAFAGRAGGISTRHYDHDINFQILLEGEKVWRLEANRHLTNPLRPYHPKRTLDGSIGGFSEAAHASAPELPLEFDPAHTLTIKATPGTVVFLPRGHWHEVDSLSTTWGVNLVLKGITWAQAMGAALTARLQTSPEFREYCERVSYGEGLSEAEVALGAEHFELLRTATSTALRELTRTEVALAPLATFYSWVSPPESRRIFAQGEAWFLSLPGLAEPIEVEQVIVAPLERLLAFRAPFSWTDALNVARSLQATGLYNLFTDLTALGVLKRSDPPPAPR